MSVGSRALFSPERNNAGKLRSMRPSCGTGKRGKMPTRYAIGKIEGITSPSHDVHEGFAKRKQPGEFAQGWENRWKIIAALTAVWVVICAKKGAKRGTFGRFGRGGKCSFFGWNCNLHFNGGKLLAEHKGTGKLRSLTLPARRNRRRSRRCLAGRW